MLAPLPRRDPVACSRLMLATLLRRVASACKRQLEWVGLLREWVGLLLMLLRLLDDGEGLLRASWSKQLVELVENLNHDVLVMVEYDFEQQ